ncbi:sensor histidine kinase [Profundibacterium mesophilum]|uniref:histidine kinase n=1 Tax=Profundibacterium mesophilum KAUST100406-0324 TaxID=1037889 RepID=A0A921NV70_9RHOB|nr:sensor histidine kinase [Profundibacterium mesophilum]KAF0676105.1 two-component system chemotaxis family CheBCheR fusion protein [Profundibacterium mesophilum KAUST100406-0324]
MAASDHPAVLICAPLRQDALQIATSLGADFPQPTVICEDIVQVRERVGDLDHPAAGMLIISQEAASKEMRDLLDEILAHEPAWSRMPVLFLVSANRASPPACGAGGYGGHEHHYVVLERPVRPDVLRRLCASLCAARRRQFEMAALLEKLREAERNQRFLFDELQHRMRNMLAVLQAIFKLSARRARDLNSFVDSFEARLASFASTHSALSRDRTQRMDLADLVRINVETYSAHEGQLSIDGPPTELPAALSFEIAIIVHELATNAAKYGALSTSNGRVEVKWQVRQGAQGGRNVEIDWRERGGPPVHAPVRKGLGSALIKGRNLAGASRIEVTYDPDGLHWHGWIDLDAA